MAPVLEKNVNNSAFTLSGVPRVFPSGQISHPEDQIEEENEDKLRKNGRK